MYVWLDMIDTKMHYNIMNKHMMYYKVPLVRWILDISAGHSLYFDFGNLNKYFSVLKFS